MNSNSSPSVEVQEATPVAAPVAPADYQAPAIESVFTSDQMEREVLYAGQPNPSFQPV